MPQTKTPIELHNASFSATSHENGEISYTFCDPFVERPLSPESPAESIEDQPDLKRGLDYLRENRDRISVDIMGAPHGEETVHDIKELDITFGSHDSIFFEGIGHDKEARDLLWQVSSGTTETLTGDQAAKFGQYGQQKLAVLLRKNKPTFFADIPGDGTAYEDQLLEWSDLLGQILKIEDDSQTGIGAMVNLTATTIVREWYMIATIGKELSNLEAAGYTSTNPLFLVGTRHRETLPQKLNVLGVKSNIIVPRIVNKGEQRTMRMPFDFVQAVANCAIKYTP